MKLKILAFIILLGCFGSLHGQSFQEKLFKDRGSKFSVSIFPAFETDSNPDMIDQYTSIGIFRYHFGMRYNFVEVNDDLSFGLGVAPALELGMGFYKSDESELGGLLGFNMPLELSFNFGAGATYNTAKNIGFALKSGIDLNFSPLFLSSIYKDGSSLKRFYGLPYLTLAIRHWSSNATSLREFNIQYVFGKNPKNIQSDLNIGSPIIIRIGFYKIIDY